MSISNPTARIGWAYFICEEKTPHGVETRQHSREAFRNPCLRRGFLFVRSTAGVPSNPCLVITVILGPWSHPHPRKRSTASSRNLMRPIRLETFPRRSVATVAGQMVVKRESRATNPWMRCLSQLFCCSSSQPHWCSQVDSATTKGCNSRLIPLEGLSDY